MLFNQKILSLGLRFVSFVVVSCVFSFHLLDLLYAISFKVMFACYSLSYSVSNALFHYYYF